MSLFDTFLNNNKKQLLNIAIVEKDNNGDGVLFINFNKTDKNNVDVYYLTNDKIPEKILIQFKDLFIENKNKDVIYYFLYYNNESNIIVIDMADYDYSNDREIIDKKTSDKELDEK